MTVGIGIVAHRDRYPRANYLATLLGAEVVGPDGVDYLDGEFVTSEEDGPERNHLKVWEWLSGSKTDWSVVLEDDAIPIADFSEELQGILAVSPSPIIGLYLGRGRPPHWIDPIASVMNSDAHFLMATEVLNCVGLAIKTKLLPVLCDHLREHITNLYYYWPFPIDELISRWVSRMGLKVAYCHPSIVDHDNSLPTLISYHKTSHHLDDCTTRDELRTAWMLGGRGGHWINSRIDIPTPMEIKPGIYQMGEVPKHHGPPDITPIPPTVELPITHL